MLAVLIPAAAWAGEYFSTADKEQIRQTVRVELPGAKVDFKDTEIKGAGVLIGPLPDGNNLFIHANSDADVVIYRFPVEYRAAAMKIIETVYRIVDNRSASVALGRDLIK